MKTPKMIMLVGLPASGKSTYAKKLAKEYDANIHSSDAIREELSGDISNQNINELVFKTLHNRIKEDLKSGKSCIYDATNINYKRRMGFLNELNKIPCYKFCYLMATPYEKCLKNNSNRDRKVPEEVIERMYRNFDVPYYYEGWSEIITMYIDNDFYYYGSPLDFVSKHSDFDQENTHHTLSLGSHCYKALKYIATTMYSNGLIDYFDKWHLLNVSMATLLHDCGKPFCKTFTNTKGEITEQAHYYNHERTGSYNSLFYNELDVDNLYVATLIRWHMQPYFWEKDNNEKLHNKYRKLWGEYLYNDIMMLHEADKAAH